MGWLGVNSFKTGERYEYVVWDEKGPLADFLNDYAEIGFRLVAMTEAPIYETTTQTVVMERKQVWVDEVEE